MIPVVTVSQMRLIDEEAIGHDPTIGYSYMVRAGTGIFSAARAIVPEHGGGEIGIVCGKGNNGGDGYVAARLLLEAGYGVMCFSVCPVDELGGEARLAYNEFISRKGNVLVIDDAADLAGLPHHRLIIDAILGTGARGDPHGMCAMAINAINESREARVPVIAADTPSGLDNDTGRAGNPCVRATMTVTMGFPKVGLYFHPGRELAGEIVIQELGYPDEILDKNKPEFFFPEPAALAGMLPRRRHDGGKFDHGLALFLCGSRGMTGSAALVAKAALRTGCGMTHLAAPASVVPVLCCKLTETVIHPVAETAEGAPAEAAFEKIAGLAGSMQALCVGPGITHSEETGALVRRIVSNVKLPTVLDADGLNAYKGCPGDLGSHAGGLIITPHRGEWQRLFGELPAEPVSMACLLKRKARELGVTILLKGNPTMVADTMGCAYLLPFGNSSLAKAGSGDVLSGIIVSLLAQGASPVHAAILGTYIHGEAGTLASMKLGEYSVIPTDVVNTIHRVIMHLCELAGSCGDRNDKHGKAQSR